MADYSNTLELFKQLQQNGATDVRTSSPQMDSRPKAQYVTAANLDQLTEAVFGRSQSADEKNGNEMLIETLKEVETGQMTEETRQRIAANVKNSKMNPAILNSILQNPLIETKVGNDEIDEFVKKTLQGNKNIEASRKIIQKTMEQDNASKQPLNESRPAAAQSIDYGKIASLIESAVDKKMNEMQGRVPMNESATSQAPTLKVVQAKSGTRFLFVDTDDNVYECTIVYKGKNRKKN